MHQLRDGHTLLLIGARTAAQHPHAQQQQQRQHQQQQQGVEVHWDESWPEAAAQDMSCLPALLTTPALQSGLLCQLEDLLSQQPDMLSQLPAMVLVEARIGQTSVKAARVHGTCGRQVSRASFGLGDLEEMEHEAPGQVDAIECEGGAGQGVSQGGAAGALWECAFCCVECSTAETEFAWSGSLMIESLRDGVEDRGLSGGGTGGAGAGGGGGGTGAGGSSAGVGGGNDGIRAGGTSGGCDVEHQLPVAAEPHVWRTLLPFSVEQWRRLVPQAAAARVQRAAVRRACRVCLCRCDTLGAGSPSFTATQLILL